MLDSVASGVFDVLKCLFWVELEPLSYLDDPFRSEGALRINIDHFSIATSFFLGQLGSHAKGMG